MLLAITHTHTKMYYKNSNLIWTVILIKYLIKPLSLLTLNILSILDALFEHQQYCHVFKILCYQSFSFKNPCITHTNIDWKKPVSK